jgi:hypothetical protein
MNKPILMLFRLTFAGLFLFMLIFIMKLGVSHFDSFSYLGKANFNAGFTYYNEPEKNSRPPLYSFLLTPVAALQHLGVSIKAVMTMANVIALLFSFAFIRSSYLILKYLLPQELAALGALLMMIQPAFLVYSFEPMVDLPCSLLLVLAMQSYFRYRNSPNRKNLFLTCMFTGLGMVIKYSLVVAPLIIILAEILVLRTKEKMRWSSIFKNRFICFFPLISTGVFFLTSLISFYPQYGWTWKNISMIYAPFFSRLEFNVSSNFQFDYLANFSFLETQMTLPWLVLMILGLYFCIRDIQWQNMIIWSWFFVLISFFTFIIKHYEIRYLFPVMPACYFFGLFAIKIVYGWVQKRMVDKSYFFALRLVVLFSLLAWPAMNLMNELQSLSNDFYSNKIPVRIAEKVKELSNEKDVVFYAGHFYPLYQYGDQVNTKDDFYKIYHLASNGLSFLSARKIVSLPRNTPYEYAPNFKNGTTLIYYPGPPVYSKFFPAPESLPPILVGNVKPFDYALEKNIGDVKKFLIEDGSSQMKLTSLGDNQVLIEISEDSKLNKTNILWFNMDRRNIESREVRKNFFLIKANHEIVLKADREYFDRIQGITLLNYEAEEFR